MDSGSGSLQSSSGGDEEYDSRPAAFLNHPSSLLPHHQQHQQQPTFMDPSPNFFHAFSHHQQSPPNPNLNSSLLNLDVVGPQSQSIMGSTVQGSGHRATPLSSMQSRSVHDNGAPSSSPSDQTHVVTRNPKKRTRASRRAPTTVLTTDTTNFRAMVQEFTGIPAPPFSASPFSRRFDLFGSGSGLRTVGHLEPVGSLYPLRPSAQKVNPFVSLSSSSRSSSSSFLNNSTMADANIAATTTTNNNVNTITSATTSTFIPTSISFQLPSNLSLPKQQQQNVINMQNQMLSFQSLVQPPPLLPSLNLHGLGEKSQTNMPLPSLDELGMSHGQVNANLGGLSSQGITTEEMQLRNDSNSWRDGVGSNDGSRDQLRSFEGNYGNLQRGNSSCKLNYSSDFHHDKSLENISNTRGEGTTVDSWICPPSEFRIRD